MQAESVATGQFLKQEGYEFDIAFTSLPRRAIKTLWAVVLKETDRTWMALRPRGGATIANMALCRI